MRVLQLIDSLRPGGAEKMAVNIANALLPYVKGSYLCCTRQEGLLKEQIKPEVGYVFLNKKYSLDPNAIFKLKKYIRENKIEIVHAHSTSYFIAAILKFTGSGFKLIWHDHYGESEFLDKREFRFLKKFSRIFSGIISVNTDLKNWAIENLHCLNVVELNNFIPEPVQWDNVSLNLKGTKTDFKIICVANLRPQKDHLNLIQAFEMLDPELKITLHIIGEDPRTPYSAKIIKAIEESPVRKKLFYYGSQPGILHLLKQANLGILSSTSEGLPLALIEYGMAGLPVICTRIGKCENVIGVNGILVPPRDPHSLFLALMGYLNDPEKRIRDSRNFQSRIQKDFSEAIGVKKILDFYLV